MKILILVLSLDDGGGIYSKFYETQKETWDSIEVDGIKTFYYFGNSNENKIVNNNIYTNIPESLENCGPKTIETFKLIRDMDFDYVFRTNSSSYVDKKLLELFLANKPKHNFYSGIIGNHNGMPFCSGSGFVLSKDLVELLISNENILEYNHIDDVCFARFLNSKRIPLVQSSRFDVVNNSEINYNFFHYRLKTYNRYNDIHNMKLIHIMKLINNDKIIKY